MTAATGLKRLGFILLAIIAGGLVVLTTAGYLISADTVRQQVVSEIRAVTGLDPVLRGKASVSLFPIGSVTFADVILGDAKQPALTAERLTARLRFFPLLIGRVQIADVSLDRPSIAIELQPNGQSNWSGLIEALMHSQTDTHRLAAFSEMRIDGGTVVIHDEALKLTETLNGVEFSLAWPSISKSFGATGRFVWHDAPMDASLTLADFPAALAGSRSGLRLRVSGAPMKAAFEGAVSFKPTLKIEGTLAADLSSKLIRFRATTFVVDGHARAGQSEAHRRLGADAARRAGDERHFAGEIDRRLGIRHALECMRCLRPK